MRFLPALLASALLFTACDRFARQSDDAWPESNKAYAGTDHPRAEEDAFRWATRQFYNNRRFDALEKQMADTRAANPPSFGNGSSKIYVFYQSLRCRDDEQEGMWQLHEKIHQDWDKAMPQSSTAHIAHADFLVEYAWHARGGDVASNVTPEGYRLFQERLAQAQEILTAAKALTPQCPMWWDEEMRVALGQGWKRPDFDRVAAKARQTFPQFSKYSLIIAEYLSPKWYGQPGDWEKDAETESQRPEGLGLEGYTRVVCQMRSGYDDNIFHNTQASWPKTRAGFEEMLKKYPESLSILSTYCQVACSIGDRPLAQRLFTELHGHVDKMVWISPSYYNYCHKWAFPAQSLRWFMP